MTARGWPSPTTRRRFRRTLWRNRHAVRAVLVGLAVLCTVQSLTARSVPLRPGAGPTPAPTTDVPTHTDGTGPGPGLVTTLVRLADPDAGLLVRPGDTVDILATPAGALEAGDASQDRDTAAVVASSVHVVGVPAGAGPDPDGDQGTVLLVAVPPITARVLAGAAMSRLSAVVRSAATVP